MAGTVTTQVIYEQGGASGTQGPSTSETVSDPADGSASGEANEGGSSATAKNPNGEGGEDTTVSHWKLPEGATFERANVNVTLRCPDGRVLSLEGAGNVSATGRVEGECIHVTQVNRSVVNGVEKTTTRTKKKCCSDAREKDASLPPPKELEFANVLKLDRETLTNLELLKRVLKL